MLRLVHRKTVETDTQELHMSNEELFVDNAYSTHIIKHWIIVTEKWQKYVHPWNKQQNKTKWKKKDDIRCANKYVSIVLGFLFFTLSSVCQAHFIVTIFHTKIPQIEIDSFYYLSCCSSQSPTQTLLIHYSMRI